MDLANPAGSGLGDNQADTVIVNGTAGSDAVTVTGSPAGVSVAGLSAIVNIVGSEPDFDRLIIDALAGDDVIEASKAQAGVINLTENGGVGDDVLIGSAGADVLLGGEGDDVLEGGPGSMFSMAVRELTFLFRTSTYALTVKPLGETFNRPLSLPGSHESQLKHNKQTTD